MGGHRYGALLCNIGRDHMALGISYLRMRNRAWKMLRAAQRFRVEVERLRPFETEARQQAAMVTRLHALISDTYALHECNGLPSCPVCNLHEEARAANEDKP